MAFLGPRTLHVEYSAFFVGLAVASSGIGLLQIQHEGFRGALPWLAGAAVACAAAVITAFLMAPGKDLRL